MISILLLVINLWIHPFHVSVSDIKYKEEKKVIQISSRIFVDDLEQALQVYSGNDKLDITEKPNWGIVNDLLKKYLLERIHLWDEKNKMYELHYIGAEIESDVMWCYLEVEKVKKIKSVKIQNSVLHEVWDDQENLIHFRAFDRVKSTRLYKEDNSKSFNWQ